MYNTIIEKLENKNIAILGFGKEGKSTYNFIRKYLPNQKITIIDLRNVSNDELLKKDKNIELIYGDNYLSNLEMYDLIIKAPGISLKDVNTLNLKNKITSQLELLLEVNRKNVIGITGTKGKSTTSSLLYQVLKDQNKDVFLLGNIGICIFDEIEKFKDDSILVIEMSSHQLEFVKYSPHIGIILNLFEDHLDHAGNLEHYHNIKMNMFKFQNENDIGIYSDDNYYLKERMDNNSYKSIFYNIRLDYENINNNTIRFKDKNVYFDNEIIYHDDKRLLLGDHNLKNIMFVLTVVKILNMDILKAKYTIDKFSGLKYRMEKIGTYDGITYYNDTIATIPEATINAIETLKEVDSLIFGGMDRNINYDKFIEYLKNSYIKNLICMPTTGTKIGKELLYKCNKEIFFVDSLTEAYTIAKKVTKKGKICLLSPAGSSYEYFKNFEEKGKFFEELVKQER